MKNLLRATGILLLICALILYAVAGFAQEENRPRTVTFGIMTNGVYTQTDSGLIGGNAKAVEEMNWLKGISVVSGIVGVCLTIRSIVIKKQEDPTY